MTAIAGEINGFQVVYITDEPTFLEAVEKLSKAKDLALDLEFDDNRYSYGLNLCLIQIADRETCYLIDPFRIENLQPLWEIIQNPRIVKIIHSSSNDIILLKTLGCIPQNVLDTELAAKVLDYGRTSFANMMAVIFNTEIDKSYQVSNWNTRPLLDEQLLYAANDVVYLHALHDNLLDRIKALGREDWLQEECQLLEQIEQKSQTDRYLKLRGTERLTYFELFILKELYHFREELAKSYNKPSGSVIPNEVLLNLVLQPADNFNEWQNIRGLMGRIKDNNTFKKFRQVVQEAIAQAKAEGISMSRPVRPRRSDFLVSKEVAESRKALLQPARHRIMEIYGENVASLILPQGLINDFAEGRPLEIKKKYAQKIVADIIGELVIEMPLS